MSKDKHTTPGKFPIDEFRTKDPKQAVEMIYRLFSYQRQFSVSYLDDEIIINYTTGPSHS